MSEDRERLPLLRVDPAYLADVVSKVGRQVELGAGWQVGGVCLDVNAFSGAAKALIDDGDLLPEWCYLCLQYGASIMKVETEVGTQAVLHSPQAKLTLPLTVSDLCAELGGAAWRSEAALFLLWGADQTVFHRPKPPIRCEGVLFPVLDGLGLGWAATADHARELGLPVDD